MTIRRALSVTTTVAATVPIDPPRAIPPGSFPTSLGCACCVAVESCPSKRAVRTAYPRTLTDVLPRLVTFSGACGSRCRSGFHRGQRSSWTNNHGFLEMFESSRVSSIPLPIRRSTLRRLLSAAKFRVGSGVTFSD